MDNQRILSALCYFSILFAPFLLPLIVYFVSPTAEVKYHAKRSLLSHLIPVVLGIVGFIVLVIGSIAVFSTTVDGTAEPSTSFNFLTAGLPFLFIAVYGILYLIVLIWNIIQGIKVLQ